ncbi:hypothetical protein ACHAWF_005282 [Thalassiosira exigua]
MKTYQLKFLAWTFSAFLPPDDPDAAKDDEVDYYSLLDVSRNANADDIKKAYRKRSLQLHPDKLRQRGMRYQGEIITEDEARARFQQMKAAYDALSDPKKRQIYDALGHRGMAFVHNPSQAYDPHVLLGNLARSSVGDRAKLMALVVIFFGLVLLQPILLCAKVDQMLEASGGGLENASWVALFAPFWLFAAFYAVLLVVGRAVLPLLQWTSFVAAILLLALQWDGILSTSYAVAFVPFYVWMLLRFVEARMDVRSVRADMSKMVTIEYVEKFVINEKKQDDDGNDLEDQRPHRTYNDLNEEERDEINDEYIIVHVPPKAAAPGNDEDEEEDDFDRIERSPEYEHAKLRLEYANKSIHRIIVPEIPLIVLVAVHLDGDKAWNWGLTFLPLWMSIFFECCGGCYGFFCTSAIAHIEVQEAMAEHIAKEAEAKAKRDGGAKSEGDGDESGKAEGEEEGGTQKADATLGGLEAGAEKAAEAGEPEKSGDDDKAGVDTAVSVEPTVDKAETTSSEPEAGKRESEAKDAEEGVEVEVEDDEFFFEMDEDTFHYFQQSEQEAEMKATEAQSKAVGSFCNIIFQSLIAALFVAKLNQVYEEREDENIFSRGTSSFSSFWILFPFLLVSGCIIGCFACAIFGAANIDQAMSSDDDGADGGGDEGGEAAPETADDAAGDASPVILTPPPPPPEKEKEPEKKKEESYDQEPNVAENAGNGAPPAAAAAVETESESAMDDLD